MATASPTGQSYGLSAFISSVGGPDTDAFLDGSYVPEAILGTLVVYHMIFCLPLRSMWGRLRSFELKRDPNPDADILHYAQGHFELKRAASWQTGARVVMQVNGVSLAWAAVNIAADGVYPGSRPSYALQSVFVYLVIHTIVGLVRCDMSDSWTARLAQYMAATLEAGGCSNLGRQLRSVTKYEASYALTMIWVMFYEHMTLWGASANRMALTNSVQPSTAVRVFLSAQNRNLKQTFIWNVIYQVVCIVRWNRDDLSGVTWFDVYFDIIMTTAVTWFTRRVAMEEAVNATRARAQRNEGRAVRSILNATCDAVVHLDDELNVNGSTPKLAALLLRQSPTVAGQNLRSLMTNDEDDHDVISKLLQPDSREDGQSDDEEMAKAFQVKLKDSMGNSVPVRGLHTRVTDLDGRVGHLLGLWEAADPRDVRAEDEAAERRASERRLQRGAPSEGSISEAASLSSRRRRRKARKNSLLEINEATDVGALGRRQEMQRQEMQDISMMSGTSSGTASSSGSEEDAIAAPVTPVTRSAGFGTEGEVARVMLQEGAVRDWVEASAITVAPARRATRFGSEGAAAQGSESPAPQRLSFEQSAQAAVREGKRRDRQRLQARAAGGEGGAGVLEQHLPAASLKYMDLQYLAPVVLGQRRLEDAELRQPQPGPAGLPPKPRPQLGPPGPYAPTGSLAPWLYEPTVGSPTYDKLVSHYGIGSPVSAAPRGPPGDPLLPFGETLVYPDRLRTVQPCQELCLLAAVKKWNFRLLPGDCCHFHAAIREIGQVSHVMSLGGCRLFGAKQTLEQCQACGILGSERRNDGSCCSVCAGLLEAAGSPEIHIAL